MFAIEWLPLIVKALATAFLVIFASVAAERLGSVWGAVIASLPVSAGPAYVFLAMQHEADFVAASALNSAVANGATGLFLITYSALIGRLSNGRCLGTAVAVWFLAILSFQQAAWSMASAAVANCLIYGSGLMFLRRGEPTGPGLASRPKRQWFELPIRAAMVAAFVSVVIAASSVLGPAVTGFAAVFPISLISLIVIVQLRLGGQGAASVAAKALAPMLGFGAMLLVLHRLTPAIGVEAALIVALMTCVLWSSALLLFQRRRSLVRNRDF